MKLMYSFLLSDCDIRANSAGCLGGTRLRPRARDGDNLEFTDAETVDHRPDPTQRKANGQASE
jgi:hypothetical protein